MNRDEFKELINKGMVFLDGATGTNLQMRGMPVGVCPEKWILDNREVLIDLQRSYVEAGTNIIYAPTFTGNRIKLAEYGLSEKIVEMNTGLLKISKEAAGDKAFVAGDVTMTGHQLYPMGDLTFEELVDIYKEQISILIENGADIIAIETMMSLNESRAALIAAREISEDIPVIATMTFEENGKSLFGTPPEIWAVVMESLGADAVGMNCSSGLKNADELIEKMYKHVSIPIIAKPNNGLPELENGKTVYKNTPDEFANGIKSLADKGARIVGGCCGSSPDHIKAMCDLLKDYEPLPVMNNTGRFLTSERKMVEITPDGPLKVIGERINPTGKKALQEELRQGKLDIVRKFAKEQTLYGAHILDINMGTNGIDEKEMMIKSLYEVMETSDLPISIDSSYVDVIEAALRIYPGRALINSIPFEKEKFNRLIKIAKKYGAMFIFLPLTDEGIPENNKDKHAIILDALKRIEEEGIDKKNVVVDALVTTVAAAPRSAVDCLETFKFCKDELGLVTVCGLSNISFGLPERAFVNASFFAMAINNGMTMAIANPSQDLLMNVAYASDMLMNKENSDINYINRIRFYDEHKPEQVETVKKTDTKKEGAKKDDSKKAGADEAHIQLLKSKVYTAVVEGDKSGIVEFAKEEMADGLKPEEIINTHLIPSINKVGSLFNDKEYFLPQLISSANAMEKAIAYLEPLIEKDETLESKASVVIATVEGDVHDIGKNLVCLMLRNYGYDVTDLGKDVPAQVIIDTAIEKNAEIVGLSALMTTTMVRMKDVIKYAGEKGYTGKIIIGGAAVTQSYADEIGADGYSGDAADCVKLIEKLLT